MTNKKKRKRPYQPPSQEGGPRPDDETPVPAAGPGGGANMERRLRKEDARAQKEAALKQLRRREALRRIPVVLVVVGALVLGIYLLSSNRSTANAELDGLIAKASAAKTAAGCSDVEDVGPYDPEGQDRVHSAADGMPALDTYPSVPLASGPHLGATEPAGVRPDPPVIGGTIHSLEHGAVIVWYAPGAEKSPAFGPIRDFIERNPSKAILAPYDYPDEGAAGSLPEGKQMALVAWHHVQTCDDLSLPIVAKFMSQYRNPPLGDGDWIGTAPEPDATL